MILQSFAFLSTAALGTAFLISASIPDDALSGLAKEPNTLIKQQTITVGCPGCFYPVKSADEADAFVWSEGIPNSLVFNISAANNPPMLFINDVAVFPALGDVSHPLAVYQIRADESTQDFEASIGSKKALIAGTQIAWALRPTPTGEEAQSNVRTFDYQFSVTTLDNVGVTGLDHIEIVLRETDGDFFIDDLYLQPTTALGASPTKEEKAGAKKECATFPLLCKWKSIIAEKFRNAKAGLRKGCMGRPKVDRPAHEDHAAHPDGQADKGFPPSHYQHGHHDYHRHHRQGVEKVLHIMKKITVRVLVPVLIGVVAGMTASLIGMILGQATIMLWRKFYRGGKRGQYAPVQQCDAMNSDDIADEEKELLEDDLPEYTEDIEQAAPIEKE